MKRDGAKRPLQCSLDFLAFRNSLSGGYRGTNRANTCSHAPCPALPLTRLHLWSHSKLLCPLFLFPLLFTQINFLSRVIIYLDLTCVGVMLADKFAAQAHRKKITLDLINSQPNYRGNNNNNSNNKPPLWSAFFFIFYNCKGVRPVTACLSSYLIIIINIKPTSQIKHLFIAVSLKFLHQIICTLNSSIFFFISLTHSAFFYKGFLLIHLVFQSHLTTKSRSTSFDFSSKCIIEVGISFC